MKRGNPVRQAARERGGQFPPFGHRVEQAGIIEPPHFDHPVERFFAFPHACPEPDRSVRPAHNGPHRQIKFRRSPAVEAQFLLAHRAAPFERYNLAYGETSLDAARVDMAVVCMSWGIHSVGVVNFKYLWNKLAEEKGCTTAQLALAWVLAQGEDVVPIPGTKHRRYLDDNIGALEVRLTSEDLQRLDAILPPGAAAGERYHASGMATVNR